VKLRTVLLVAAVALVAVAPVHAAGTHEYGVEVGASVPSGNFGDAANTGFNIGAQYQYMITQFGVGGELKYHSWGASDNLGLAADESASFSAWQYNVYGIAKMPSPTTSPFFKAGFGWYTPATKFESPLGNTDASDTVFGIVVGGGVDFNTPGNATFGLGLNYHRLQDSEADFISIAARATFR